MINCNENVHLCKGFPFPAVDVGISELRSAPIGNSVYIQNVNTVYANKKATPRQNCAIFKI
jgi:hypothetical protein